MKDRSERELLRQAVTRASRKEKRQAIVVGDRFRSSNGTIWIVTECRLFGRGYWVVNEERTRQTVYLRNVLEKMERL